MENAITEPDESDKVSFESQKRQGDVLHLRSELLDALDEAVAAIDRKGGICDANKKWHCLSREASWLGNADTGCFVFCEQALGKFCKSADSILLGIRSVIENSKQEFHCELRVEHKKVSHWFDLRVKRLRDHPGAVAAVFLRDITISRKMEHDLCESHLLFQRVVEGIMDGIFIYDMQGRFLMHNSACADVLPLSSKQVVGSWIDDVFPKELARNIREQNQMILGTGRTFGYELAFESPQGNRTVLVQKGVYRNHRNEVVGIIGIARDITERKYAEEKLKQSECHFRALIEKSTDCILLLSERGDILYASPSSKQLCGYESHELMGTNAFFWMHPDDISEGKKRFQEILEMPGASLTAECRSLCKDGRWKWIEATTSNLLNDPSVRALILNVRDISERKEAEQVARRFTAIVESSIDGIISVDLEGKITSWNVAAQNIFGYSSTEMVGKDFRSLLLQNHLEETDEWYERVIRGRGIRDAEMVGFHRDGHHVDIAVTVSPIRGRDRRIVGIAAIVRDISERRTLQKQVLEIADFEKHRIGQDLHDDLCQHLVGISMIANLLYTELARLGLKQADEAKEITNMIRNAVEHARILAKGLSPVNVTRGGIMAGLETLASHTEQLFRMPCRFECSSSVHIENPDVAMHLYRIAQEALHNAVKHSNGTNVTIQLDACEKAVEVTVSDDGVGPGHKKHSEGGGMGMHTMYYRARLIGATLEILRNAHGGTSVVCRLPKAKAKLPARPGKSR